jgi:predicted PurR-regulated permease PerM
MKDLKLSIDTGTFVRFWLVILGFVAVIGAVWLARSAVIMVLVSFFLALVLNRPVSFIARHLPGKSRVFATMIAYLLILFVIVFVFFNVVPVFVKQISLFLDSLPGTLSAFRGNSGFLHDFLNQYHLTNQYESWLNNVQNDIGSIASGIGSSFVSIVSGLANALLNLIFIAVLTFLMLVEAPTWEEKFWRLIYKDAKRRRHHQALARKMYDVVSGYVSGQMTVAAISATLTALTVAVLGQIFGFEMSLAWPAWMVVFVMTFVPMFGAFIGGTIVGLLLLLYAWPAAVIYLIFFIIEQQIENNLISPHIQSKRLHLSALVILTAIIVGLQVAGILGALVAIPAAGCVAVLIRDGLRARRVRTAAEHGQTIDPDNDKGDVAIVFNIDERKFVKPTLSKRRKQKSRSD